MRPDLRDEPTWSALPPRAVVPPSPGERAAAVARLSSWAAAGGARFDAIEVVLDDDGGAMVHARRPIAEGETIVAVPRQLMMIGEKDELPAWLACESRRASSPWRPFLDVLPAAFPGMPIFHGGAELEALAGTLTRRIAANAHARVLEGFAALAADVREAVTLADYAWACGVVSSRAVNVKFPGQPRAAFVPIVDFMNHEPGASRTSYAAAADALTVVARRAFAPGDEVTLDYGPKSNGSLLVGYGFVLAENPHRMAGVLLGEWCVVRPDLDQALFVARGDLDALEHALHDALARLEDSPERTGEASWQNLCAAVRQEERRVLAQLLVAARARRAP